MRQIALLSPNSIYFLTYLSVKSNKLINDNRNTSLLKCAEWLKNGETSNDCF